LLQTSLGWINTVAKKPIYSCGLMLKITHNKGSILRTENEGRSSVSLMEGQ